MRTVKFIYLIGALFLGVGCSTSKYVLNTRAPTGFLNFFSPPRESDPIQAEGDTALLYDRSRWVVMESQLADGSVWVHYALQIKNAGNSAVHPLILRASIESNEGDRVLASLLNEDKTSSCNSIEAKTLCRVDVKFLLPPKIVSSYGGSGHSLSLSVPLQGQPDLRQKVWLWKE